MAKKAEEKKTNELLTETTEESTAEETTSTVTDTAAEELSEEYWNERVPLMIPRDLSNPKEQTKTIIINGYVYQIKRGVQVMVPRKVFQVYMDSEAQRAKAVDYSEGAKDEN